LPPAGSKRLTEIIPFRGLRYNQQLVPDLSAVVSPPYDIIGPRAQLHFHEKHPDNAIHLDFGLAFPGDGDSENRYTRAAALLQQWLAGDILRPEPRPAIYFLREEYQTPGGAQAVREGFICAVRLADFSEGRILPHEQTAPGPKEDRLRLIEATEANLSPIFLLYSDPENAVARQAAESGGTPALSLTDEAGTRHTLWVLDEPEEAEALSDALSRGTLLIADGHHRYETMLAYRDQRRAAEAGSDRSGSEHPGGSRPYDFTMAYLANMDSDSRSVLPIHRFVSRLSAATVGGVAELLGEHFEVLDVPGAGQARQQQMIEMMAAHGRERNAFGMYLPASDDFRVLAARRPRPLLAADDDPHSAAYRSLDVTELDRIILAGALGIRPGGANADARIRFVERTEAAFRQIDAGEAGAQIAIFVNPTSMEEIRDVAEAGEKMPRKSTYFYPKPLTGLVFRSLKF
jgi:uncharacterized protein (DUF1015 family)